MKPVTPEQLQAHTNATYRGVAEGLAFSGTVGGLGGWYLNRKYAGWRALPKSLKSLAMVILVVPTIAIQAERRGVEYDKSTWEGDSVRVQEAALTSYEQQWEAMSTKEKIADWSSRHEYTIIMGSWALSLAVAGAVISRDKYQTFPQKIVQARMWAQGLTIGILIAAGALTSAKRAEAAAHPSRDHSWRDLLDQQERDKALTKIARPEGTYNSPISD